MNDIERYNFWNYEIDSYLTQLNKENKVILEFTEKKEELLDNTNQIIETT